MTDVAKWIILRTSAARTLQLAKSLAEAGFNVWTPTTVSLKTVPRGREKVEIEVEAPIVPTFVFGDGEQVDDFARVRATMFNGHPDFSIFQRAGMAPLINARSLAPLWWASIDARARLDAIYARRLMEKERQDRIALLRTEQQRRKALRAERKRLPAGLQVVVEGMPALGGLAGSVVEERNGGRAAVVAFGGALVMEIEAWQLIPVHVSEGVAVTASAGLRY